MKLSSLKQHIEELDAKSTKGPWVKENHFMYPDGPLLKTTKGMHICYGVGIASEDEIDFIALSRTALPELLRRLLVAEEAILNAESALHWALDKKPSPCRCVSFSTPPHVCVAHKAINEAIDALKTIRGEEE